MENGRGLIPSDRDAAAGVVVWPMQGLEKAVVVVLPLPGLIYLIIPKTPITSEIGALAPSPGGVTSLSAALQKRAMG